jgi:hypothetical protein
LSPNNHIVNPPPTAEPLTITSMSKAHSKPAIWYTSPPKAPSPSLVTYLGNFHQLPAQFTEYS